MGMGMGIGMGMGMGIQQALLKVERAPAPARPGPQNPLIESP